MKYYSTNLQAPRVGLKEAVVNSMAPDKGLYMPEYIPQMPTSFFEEIEGLCLQEIALRVAQALLGEDVEESVLRHIVYEALNFDFPIVKVAPKLYSLELFHGPTLAFKDVGARFMARLLRHFLRERQQVNVLVATSGDTGSAVANGFLGVEGIHVDVLYPRGRVSPIQEMQFATLGRNITAIAVEGTFDNCQAIVKLAFADRELNARFCLTSANSINLARLLPQCFYYFYAYAQMKCMGKTEDLVLCVPSGNFGNLAAGLIAHQMGLPIKRFVAANNSNDVFHQYLITGRFEPRASVRTMANAMDVGNPSNFARISSLFHQNLESIRNVISGYTVTDEDIMQTILDVYQRYHYLLDPHGACAFKAISESLKEGEHGVFLETAHPAKFTESMTAIIGKEPEIPERLKAFMNSVKKTVVLDNDFNSFKSYLLNR